MRRGRPRLVRRTVAEDPKIKTTASGKFQIRWNNGSKSFTRATRDEVVAFKAALMAGGMVDPRTVAAPAAGGRTFRKVAGEYVEVKRVPQGDPCQQGPGHGQGCSGEGGPAPVEPKAVELPAYVIVERKRRYANVTTRVLDLKHAECPVAPVQLGDSPALIMSWAAECTDHGERGYYRRKDIAEANAADPWIFCGMCAEAMGDYISVKR